MENLERQITELQSELAAFDAESGNTERNMSEEEIGKIEPLRYICAQRFACESITPLGFEVVPDV